MKTCSSRSSRVVPRNCVSHQTLKRIPGDNIEAYSDNKKTYKEIYQHILAHKWATHFQVVARPAHTFLFSLGFFNLLERHRLPCCSFSPDARQEDNFSAESVRVGGRSSCWLAAWTRRRQLRGLALYLIFYDCMHAVVCCQFVRKLAFPVLHPTQLRTCLQ